MDIEQTFKSFGITKKETRVYLAALELGETLPKRLADHAGVIRTTLYEMLPHLLDKGLIIQTIKGKKRYLAPADPQKFIARKKADLTVLELAKPELLAIFNSSSEKPKVLFYEGMEGIKKLYLDILETKNNVRAFSGVKNISDELLSWLHEFYEPIRVQNQIFVRNIANEAPDLNIIMPQGEMRENRLISEKIYPIQIEILIYGNKVGYATIHKDSVPTALIVENKEIADSMKSVFEVVWKVAKKQTNRR